MKELRHTNWEEIEKRSKKAMKVIEDMAKHPLTPEQARVQVQMLHEKVNNK